MEQGKVHNLISNLNSLRTLTVKMLETKITQRQPFTMISSRRYTNLRKYNTYYRFVTICITYFTSSNNLSTQEFDSYPGTLFSLVQKKTNKHNSTKTITTRKQKSYYFLSKDPQTDLTLLYPFLFNSRTRQTTTVLQSPHVSLSISLRLFFFFSTMSLVMTHR